MKPKISVVTLGINSLEKSLKFYRDGLGWQTKGIMATQYQEDDKDAAGAVVMFRLNDDLILALYPRKELAKDANRPLDPKSATEFSLGHLVESRSEVDELIDLAVVAGAIITEPPRERPWGIYSGYFQDPDGHPWEIIWNPE